MSELADAIADVASVLSEVHVRALAAAYRSAGVFSQGGAAKVRQVVPAPHFAEVDNLNQGWEAQPNLDGTAIALALETAQSSRRRRTSP